MFKKRKSYYHNYQKIPENCFAIMVIEDRYGGVYSGGSWLGIANYQNVVKKNKTRFLIADEEANGDDWTAEIFWDNPPHWIATGGSPHEAIDNLIKQLDLLGIKEEIHEK